MLAQEHGEGPEATERLGVGVGVVYVVEAGRGIVVRIDLTTESGCESFVARFGRRPDSAGAIFDVAEVAHDEVGQGEFYR